MEMQAVGRAVRKGQTQIVFVYVPYISGTIDDNHRNKHDIKTDLAKTITGDAEKDEMYTMKDTRFDSEAVLTAFKYTTDRIFKSQMSYDDGTNE